MLVNTIEGVNDMSRLQPKYLDFKCPKCGHEWLVELQWYKGHPTYVKDDATDCPECGETGYEN